MIVTIIYVLVLCPNTFSHPLILRSSMGHYLLKTQHLANKYFFIIYLKLIVENRLQNDKNIFCSFFILSGVALFVVRIHSCKSARVI